MKPLSRLLAAALGLMAAVCMFPASAAQELSPEAPSAQEPSQQEPSQEPTTRATPSYGPETARATREAAQRYADIAKSGGWPRIAKPLGPDSHGKPVDDLRRRLAIEGYISKEASDSANWDTELTEAVKAFQANMGLEQTGAVSRQTLRELNVKPADRARALAATAARLSRMRFHFGDRYVTVNIPATAVEAVEGDRALAHYDAIVGGKRDPSPQIATRIISVDVNPTWTVPASIIRKELLPKLKRNPTALARQHIRVLDGRGRDVDPSKLRRLSASRAASFTFRQDPGPMNALGSLRINMPNSFAVFMHDTPQKKLFDRDYRFLSHGCVRVEGVHDLAAWLLDPEGKEWDEAALRDEVEQGRTEKIRLRHPTPVAWVYMTGWATGDGPAHFRHDIYNLDRGGKSKPRDGRRARR
jgi:murein L,D-transpeptidase YcbB/YkuD